MRRNRDLCGSGVDEPCPELHTTPRLSTFRWKRVHLTSGLAQTGGPRFEVLSRSLLSNLSA